MALESEINFIGFFTEAPKMNPSRALITGVVCGVRVENVEDDVMREIRYLDISPKGKPTTRQDHPKTARSRRTIQLPEFATTAMQRRLKKNFVDIRTIASRARGTGMAEA